MISRILKYFKSDELTLEEQNKFVADFIYMLCARYDYIDIKYYKGDATLIPPDIYKKRLLKGPLSKQFLLFVKQIPIKVFAETSRKDLEIYLTNGWNKIKEDSRNELKKYLEEGGAKF